MCLLVEARPGPGRKEERLRQRLSSQGRELNCSHHLTITCTPALPHFTHTGIMMMFID